MMAAKKTAKPRKPKVSAQNAAPANAVGASGALSRQFGRGEVPEHRDVWAAKAAVQSMDLVQLEEYAKANPGMIRNGRGIVAAIAARRAELSK